MTLLNGESERNKVRETDKQVSSTLGLEIYFTIKCSKMGAHVCSVGNSSSVSVSCSNLNF